MTLTVGHNLYITAVFALLLIKNYSRRPVCSPSPRDPPSPPSKSPRLRNRYPTHIYRSRSLVSRCRRSTYPLNRCLHDRHLLHWQQIALTRPKLHRTLQRTALGSWTPVRSSKTTDNYLGDAILGRKARRRCQRSRQVAKLHNFDPHKRHKLGAGRQHL